MGDRTVALHGDRVRGSLSPVERKRAELSSISCSEF